MRLPCRQAAQLPFEPRLEFADLILTGAREKNASGAAAAAIVGQTFFSAVGAGSSQLRDPFLRVRPVQPAARAGPVRLGLEQGRLARAAFGLFSKFELARGFGSIQF